MSHLGRWLSALVDGELDDTERDRVLNHLAGCQSCLAEANDMRALKRRLIALGDADARAGITDRLIYLARRDQDSLAWAAHPSSESPAPQAGPAVRRAFQVRQMIGVLRWRIATGAAGSALVAVGCAAFLLGSSQPGSPVPRITPAVDAYWPQHGYDTDQVPVTAHGSATSVAPAASASPAPGLMRLQPLGHRIASDPFSLEPLLSMMAPQAVAPPQPSSQPPGARSAHHTR